MEHLDMTPEQFDRVCRRMDEGDFFGNAQREYAEHERVYDALGISFHEFLYDKVIEETDSPAGCTIAWETLEANSLSQLS